ncbi:unnamed protein product [Musa hybrid cultivar]
MQAAQICGDRRVYRSSLSTTISTWLHRRISSYQENGGVRHWTWLCLLGSGDRTWFGLVSSI